MNEEQQKIFNFLININNAEEMQVFINKKFGIIYSILRLNPLKYGEIRLQLVNKITNTISSKFLYDLIEYLWNYMDNINLSFVFLHNAYTNNHQVFETFFEKHPDLLKDFFHYYRNKEGFNKIFKKLNDKEKAIIIINSPFFPTESYQLFFSSHDELISFITHLSEEDATKVFNNLPLYEQKAVIMSNLKPKLITEMLKYFYNKSIKSKDNDDEKDFILNALLSTYKNGNKIGLLLLLNLCDNVKQYGIILDNSKFANKAYISDLDIFQIYSKSITIALPKTVIQNEGYPVFFHEFGHFLFKSVNDNDVPLEFDESVQKAQHAITQNGLFAGKCLILNDFLVKIRNLFTTLSNRFQDPKISATLQKNIYQYINNNLKISIIDYMRANGYDPNLIKSIEENFESFDINELTNLATFDEIHNIINIIGNKMMGEYLMLEDLINAIFAGNLYAYIDYSRINYTTCHSPEYFALIKSNQFNECIADFTSICLTGNIELINFLKVIIGEDLFNILKNTYLSFALNGIPEEDKELRSQIESSLFYDNGHTIESLETAIQEMSQEELIELINNKGSKLFSSPTTARSNEMHYANYDPNDDPVQIFINIPSYVLKKDISLFRKCLYTQMTYEQKEKIIKHKKIDKRTKQELIKFAAREAYSNNEDDLSAIISLIDKMFIINTDILYVFQLVENIINLKRNNPDFSLYNAIYGEIKTTGGR